jgi:hypothetical protein
MQEVMQDIIIQSLRRDICMDQGDQTVAAELMLIGLDELSCTSGLQAELLDALQSMCVNFADASGPQTQVLGKPPATQTIAELRVTAVFCTERLSGV